MLETIGDCVKTYWPEEPGEKREGELVEVLAHRLTWSQPRRRNEGARGRGGEGTKDNEKCKTENAKRKMSDSDAGNITWQRCSSLSHSSFSSFQSYSSLSSLPHFTLGLLHAGNIQFRLCEQREIKVKNTG
jgi:hypothetical protein